MLISTLIIGLVLGGTYALLALGLTIQYGIARIMNLAYGEMVIAGAFFTMVMVTALNLSPLIGLIAVIPLGYGLSWLLYDIVLRPLARRSKSRGQLEVDSILVTFGLLFLAQGLYQTTFGGGFQGYGWLQNPVTILGTSIAGGRIIGLAFSVLIGGLLFWAMRRTRWGVNMRAVASKPQFAALVGIDADRVARMAFATGGALAAAGGAILSMYQPFTAADGTYLTMKALIIVIMGGVGNLAGALMAGLIIGLIETGVSVAISPGLTLAATYLIFIFVLLVRPNGLFSN